MLVWCSSEREVLCSMFCVLCGKMLLDGKFFPCVGCSTGFYDKRECIRYYFRLYSILVGIENFEF